MNLLDDSPRHTLLPLMEAVSLDARDPIEHSIPVSPNHSLLHTLANAIPHFLLSYPVRSFFCILESKLYDTYFCALCVRHDSISSFPCFPVCQTRPRDANALCAKHIAFCSARAYVCHS